ncbi:site-specific integrase [Paenibacillus selenitireducens]|uniref:Site-specific integrase n=1 Tax=Paenibacillus selenitireducens TaxID=1324314 RepID=A0A1T2XL81_9BACL|nr:site-specific integrase [Paenibacillus selenitireducens]
MELPVYKDGKAKKNPYYFVFYSGKFVNGKRERIKKRGFKTQKEATLAMAAAMTENENGEYKKGKNTKFSDFITTWLENKRDLSKGTRELYDSYLRTHIIPLIGDYYLERITAMDVESFISSLHDRGLAQNSVKRIFAVFNTSMNYAFKMGLIKKNVALSVVKPKAQRKELTVWNSEQINRFFALSKEESRYSITFFLAIMTGMRQGEILGLHWNDIDFENKVIHIQHTLSHKNREISSTLKTQKSIRSIAITDETIARLIEHRGKIEIEKQWGGPNYIDIGLVVCTSEGNPVPPRSMYKVWERLVKKYEMPYITFHDLRHTHASMLLQQKVHPKVVSERLGHSSISITMDTYSHLMPNIQAESIEGLDRVIKGDA